MYSGGKLIRNPLSFSQMALMMVDIRYAIGLITVLSHAFTDSITEFKISASSSHK